MNRIMLPLAACALVLGACGSGSGDNSSADNSEQQGLKFARCMREHGVDIPDPQTSKGPGGAQNFSFRVGGPGAKGKGRGPDPQRVEGAMKECRKYMPNGGKPPSAAQQQEMRDAALKFSRCMREHGIDFPDPKTGPGGGVMIGGPGSKFNPSSPSFQAAQKACQGLMPGPRGAQLSSSGSAGGDDGPSTESSP